MPRRVRSSFSTVRARRTWAGTGSCFADGHGVGWAGASLPPACARRPKVASDQDRSVEQRQLARRVEQMQFGQSQPELDQVAGRKR